MFKKLSLVVAGLAVALVWMITGTAQAAGEKVTICHLTSSETNPYVWITVSVNALKAHFEHGDFIPTDTTVGCTTGGGDPVLE